MTSGHRWHPLSAKQERYSSCERLLVITSAPSVSARRKWWYTCSLKLIKIVSMLPIDTSQIESRLIQQVQDANDDG